MTPIDLFMYTAAVTLGLGLSSGLLLVLAALVDQWQDLVRAAARYAHRNEVVVEEYDVASMQKLRRIHNPTPDRVHLARKGRKL